MGGVGLVIAAEPTSLEMIRIWYVPFSTLPSFFFRNCWGKCTILVSSLRWRLWNTHRKLAIELSWFVSGRILLRHPIISPQSNYACISRGRVEGNPITYLPSPILFADSSCDIPLKMWPSFNGWKKTTSQKFSHWWHPGLSPHRLKPIAIRPSVCQLWKASPSIDSEVSHLKIEQRIFFFFFLLPPRLSVYFFELYTAIGVIG